MAICKRLSLSFILSGLMVTLFYASAGQAVSALSYFEADRASQTVNEARLLRFAPVTAEDRDMIYLVAINFMIERHGYDLIFCKRADFTATRVGYNTYRRKAGVGHWYGGSAPKSLNNVNNYYQPELQDDGKTNVVSYFADCSKPGYRYEDARQPVDLSSFPSYVRTQLFWGPANAPVCFVSFESALVNPDNTNVMLPLSFACGPLYGYAGRILLRRTLSGWQFEGLVETVVY